MRFVRVRYPPDEGKTVHNLCYLINDNWDDFSFKTSFSAILFDRAGDQFDLGPLKIMQIGMGSGRVDVPDSFDELGKQFCSLGSDRDYYLKLSGIDNETRKEYLRSIRDCVADKSIWLNFRGEKAMQDSLLRSVSVHDVEVNFPHILAGYDELTSFAFSYQFEAGPEEQTEACDFRVEPGSLPPTNIHVLIGRNGVGKTRLLAGMADALTENQASSIGVPGHFSFDAKIHSGTSDFLNLIIVSYSVFDRFDPIEGGTARSKKSVPYHYVGIRKFTERIHDGVGRELTLKSAEDLNAEFDASLESMLTDKSRMARWRKAVEVLESDPGIRELNLTRMVEVSTRQTGPRVMEQFASLSSGHKVVLLIMTKMVELVSDRSLVLMDEPETHLHPPLLGSFVRALSELLIERNGVAILATHSPVVLQEVPANCVSIISRSGDRIKIDRPDIETFAENVGNLTRKVFGLEVTQSGFYRLLKKHSQDGEFREVVSGFRERIGGEGRALARVFTSKDGPE